MKSNYLNIKLNLLPFNPYFVWSILFDLVVLLFLIPCFNLAKYDLCPSKEPRLTNLFNSSLLFTGFETSFGADKRE